MITQNKRLIGIVLTVVILLLIPLIAMQFTNEVNWALSDFVVMGGLLLGTGLLCELVMRKVKKFEYRIIIRGASGSASPYLGRTCSWHLRDAVRRKLDSKTTKENVRTSLAPIL